jgi:intergrase/recombinase
MKMKIRRWLMLNLNRFRRKNKITWYVHTPKLSVWRRVENFWTEDRFAENINKSMVNLKNVRK